MRRLRPSPHDNLSFLGQSSNTAGEALDAGKFKTERHSRTTICRLCRNLGGRVRVDASALWANGTQHRCSLRDVHMMLN